MKLRIFAEKDNDASTRFLIRAILTTSRRACSCSHSGKPRLHKDMGVVQEVLLIEEDDIGQLTLEINSVALKVMGIIFLTKQKNHLKKKTLIISVGGQVGGIASVWHQRTTFWRSSLLPSLYGSL